MAVADDVFLEAVRAGDVSATEALLEQGADICAPNGRGQTPLIAAVTFGGLEAVRVLLAHGADAAYRDDAGRTALSMAQGDEEIRRLLVEAVPGEMG